MREFARSTCLANEIRLDFIRFTTAYCIAFAYFVACSHAVFAIAYYIAIGDKLRAEPHTLHTGKQKRVVA